MSHKCLTMCAQTNVGLLCCVGSGSNVTAPKKKEYDKQGEVRADKRVTLAAVS
jgi:hypothetical protein